MLQAFWLVLGDLWRFLWGSGAARPDHPVPVCLPTTSVPSTLSVPAHVPALSAAPSSLVPLLTAGDAGVLIPESFPATYYVARPHGADVLLLPHLSFDGVVGHCRFGQAVTVAAFVGRYASIVGRSCRGYIDKDDLTPQVHHVRPALTVGGLYDSDARETVAIRHILQDPFAAARMGLPLQAGEYILYRLLQDNIAVPWSSARPRLAGQWHQHLRGMTGVAISILPQVDTVMEWMADDGDGRLVYVEAVLPDDIIRVSGVGIVVSGEYSEVTLPAAVWREWRPVFISIGTVA